MNYEKKRKNTINNRNGKVKKERQNEEIIDGSK